MPRLLDILVQKLDNKIQLHDPFAGVSRLCFCLPFINATCIAEDSLVRPYPDPNTLVPTETRTRRCGRGHSPFRASVSQIDRSSTSTTSPSV